MQTNEFAREAMAELVGQKRRRNNVGWQSGLVLLACTAALVASFQPWQHWPALAALWNNGNAEAANANRLQNADGQPQAPKSTDAVNRGAGALNDSTNKGQTKDSVAAAVADPELGAPDSQTGRVVPASANLELEKADGVNVSKSEVPSAETQDAAADHVVARPELEALNAFGQSLTKLASDYDAIQNAADLWQHRLDAAIADHRSSVYVLPERVASDAIALAESLFIDRQELLRGAHDVADLFKLQEAPSDAQQLLADHEGRLNRVSKTIRNVEALALAVERVSTLEALKPAVQPLKQPASGDGVLVPNRGETQPVPSSQPAQTNLGPVAYFVE